MEMPKDTQEKVEEKRYGIVKRGYDKFINIRKDQKSSVFCRFTSVQPHMSSKFHKSPLKSSVKFNILAKFT